MELKPNKDWTDAIREKYLSEEDNTPSLAGWETVVRRQRRGLILRRSAVAAAILLPFTALLLWSPWHSSLPALENPVAVTEEASAIPYADPCDESIAATDPQAIRHEDRQAKQPVSIALPEQSPLADDLPLEQQLPSTPSADTETASPDTSARNTHAPAQQLAPRRIHELVPDDLLAFAEPETKQRRKVTVGISAGTGAIQRDIRFNIMSAPYFAQLAYLNTGDAIELGSTQVNTANVSNYFQALLMTKAIYYAAYMPNPATPSTVHYVHDLPLTFGLQARLGLLSWLGVESGVEYTYLHSVADSYLGTLDQRLHFIGVPIRMNAIIWSNNLFEVYAGLGGKMEQCVSANLGKIQCEEPRLQWSVEAAGGIQYRLWNHISLYLQPELSFYLTQTDLVTYRTEHPLGVMLHAGLRLDI